MGSLVREYRQFPTGNTFKPTETVNNIADGTSITLNDPGPIFEAPPPNSDFDYCVYSRVFWNVGGTITTGASVNVTIKGATTATCWYQHGCSPGGNGVAITTYAFDADANADMAGTTPISSVTPAELWTPGSNSVTPASSGSVTIDARDSISSRDFQQWLLFGAGVPSGGDDVVIPAGAGGFYVAFYKKKTGGGILPGLFEDILLERWPDLEIDWVVDPSPLDRFRIGLIMSQLAAKSATATGSRSPTEMDAAEARKELTRVRTELKRLVELEASLQQKVDGNTR